MPIDLRSELARPFALILAALAVLGWVLFVLSSWSAASTQKQQRNQIVELTGKSDRLQVALDGQRRIAGTAAEIEARLATARDDLVRLTQTRSDVQTELAVAQKTLVSTRRDLSDADRALQSQNQKVSDGQGGASDTTGSAAEPALEPSRRKGRRSVRRRHSRSFAIRSR